MATTEKVATAEHGVGGTNKTAEHGVGGAQPQDQELQDTGGGGYPSGGYGGGGGGGGRGGGGGGGSTPKSEQKKIQAQINNQGDIYAKRADDLGDIGAKQLQNIQKQMDANNSLFVQQKRKINTNVQWQPNQQKEQSTLMALRNRMGNSAYGSAIQDLREGLGRVDDMNDVELINAYKQNLDTANENWFQANSALAADYNDQIASLKDEYSKLYSNYWTGVSNINPQLATKKNMAKAAQNAKSNALANAKTTLKAAKQTYKKSKTKANKKALSRAKKAYSKQKKKATVSVGKGTNRYTLPNVNLDPSNELQSLMKYQDLGEATSTPMVREYGARNYQLGGNNGIYQSSTAANQGFLDNLSAFRRV